MKPERIQSNRPSLSHWQYDPVSGKLVRRFSLEDRAAAIGFVNDVAAETGDQAAAITLHGRTVTVQLPPDESGDITSEQLAVARRLDRLGSPPAGA
ncbi:MAG: hypothetical protein D6696_12115 [Acidobacteria bacterium]|nr:MAG: hypothetical protein D6696_12115 [Acidobacteriota bacterium]